MFRRVGGNSRDLKIPSPQPPIQPFEGKLRLGPKVADNQTFKKLAYRLGQVPGLSRARRRAGMKGFFVIFFWTNSFIGGYFQAKSPENARQ